MPLNQKQKEAVEYLEGPLLVLAGPGTGKTQLLSEKVAYILKNTDTNPENILCLTFTESGASNMRERLKTIVGKEGLKVNIGTYHAFGSNILAQYKNYAEEYDRVLDSAIDEVTQFKIVKEILETLPARDILRKDNIKDVISVISSAKSAGLSAKNLGIIAEQNLEDSKVLSEAISPLLKEIVPRNFKESYEKAYQPIYELLGKYTNKASMIVFGAVGLDESSRACPENDISKPRVERSISILARDLKGAILEAESTEKIKPLSSWKDMYFEKDGRGNYRLKDRVANKKLASISKVMEKYDKYLLENGLYDFDDMIQEAVRVLKTDAGFKATLSERYQFIMLDEFQDTNPSQFSIIKELTDYEKPLIMAVGDDDQAIYEFQGALSTNMVDFQEHYSANVIPLVENYRSTQEILDFSREIINQATDRFADKELFAHKEAPKESQIYRYEFLSSDMEYGFIAKKISELISSGINQNDIAVISYKTKYFMPLLPFLKAYPEINIAYEKRDDLFENERIHQILTMARFVYELANERNENTSIVEILSYPFFKLPMLDVVRLVGEARRGKRSVFEYLSASENSAITEVATFFANLVAKSFNEPLEIFLDYLIGAIPLEGYRSPFLEYYTGVGEYEAFSLYESLASLKGKLRKHFGEKSLKLVDLINMVNDYIEAEMSLNTTSPYKDSDEAVSILSAHKAKGLEFKYVFIISADHTAWGKGKGNNNLLSLPKNLTHIRHTGMTDGERLRVLYVALTRAKDTLFITNSLRDFNGKSPERLEYFEEYVEGDEIISPFIPDKKVRTVYEMVSDKEVTKNLRNWLSPYVKLSPDMRSLYKERVANYKLSASGLTSFIDIVYAGPQEFFKNYVLQVPREPETEALAFGNLVHKTFEAITNNGISDEEAIRLFLEELDKRELPVEISQKIRERGPEDLMISLKKFGDILRQGKAEVNLSPEKLSIEGVPITGKIDHISIDEKNKTIEIYDFKTGGYHKEKWRSHATLYKYMLQLGFYKLLLNNSPTYAKYKVERAHILFVSPDKDDEVYDKVYEFNDEDEKELTSLIQAVYRLISTLEFLDDERIFVSADNNLGLKDIKEFVDLIIGKENA
ncbi:ATP-dependent helicase [Candidatus Saccharibacteria bacterium]|nr:ATP-dependent helicase [Candidatus Saccharibacteria bacterium]